MKIVQTFLTSLTSLISLIVLSGCSGAVAPERRIVDAAAAALGGAERIRDVRTMTLEGEGEAFALGQGRMFEGPLPSWRITGYRRAIDFDRGRWRDTATQTPTFVTGWPDPSTAVAGYDADVAFDIDEGHASRLDDITARDRRAEIYHHPLGFLRAALAPDARLENGRTEGPQDAVDLIVAHGNGERFTLFIDRDSHLPQRIVSKSHVAPLGDVTVATTFGAFGEAASVKVPSHFTTSIDGIVVREFRIAKAVVNPSPDALGDLQAPADARGASASPPARVTVEEVAPGVWYLAGEGHHSVVAEFADHLTLIEAPVDDRRTLAVIAKARTLRPGKPLTQVVNTHWHFDHSGGLRAAIAEGLTVITHAANRDFYERIAKRPATIAPDALASAKEPRPPAIETVSDKDKKVLTDGTRRLEIYPVSDSAHCAAMVMVYFRNERLLVEADAYQPPPLAGVPPRRHPFAANLLDNITTRGLKVDRILPIHGRVAAFADLVAAARTSGTPAK